MSKLNQKLFMQHYFDNCRCLKSGTCPRSHSTTFAEYLFNPSSVAGTVNMENRENDHGSNPEF